MSRILSYNITDGSLYNPALCSGSPCTANTTLSTIETTRRTGLIGDEKIKVNTDLANAIEKTKYQYSVDQATMAAKVEGSKVHYDNVGVATLLLTTILVTLLFMIFTLFNE
jgi:hypothetical protein